MHRSAFEQGTDHATLVISLTEQLAQQYGAASTHVSIKSCGGPGVACKFTVLENQRY